MIESPVTQLLNSNNIPYDVVEIPLSEDKKPIRNLEELLQSQGRDPSSVVRSILFKTKSGDFVLLAVAGSGRADWAVLRKHLGERKLRMAEFDEVEESTSYIVGAVPPIALPDAIRVLVDESVTQFDDVIIGSGVLGYALSLSNTDLLSLLTRADKGLFVKLES
ncbi:MAG: aminoacyl-tRNA deacylase [Methylophagaceae bacterium]